MIKSNYRKNLKFCLRQKMAFKDYIESWLKEEYQKFSEGFYCNWNIIEKDLNERKVFFLTENNLPVGFICWHARDKIVTFDIVEIKRDRRKLGMGKFLVEKCVSYFKRKGYLLVELQCSPAKSKRIWEKLKFLKYSIESYEPHPKMFRPLVEISEPIRKIADSKRPLIEIWDLEPYEVLKRKAKWMWQINFKEGTNKLKKIIIWPCSADWRIRYTNGKNIIDDKTKYFGNLKIYYGDFIIITELPC